MPLSLSEIDNLCRRAANLSHTWDYISEPVDHILDATLIDMFLNLYNTGLRFSELFNMSLWKRYDENTLIVTTLKGSNNRFIPESNLTPRFLSKFNSTESAYNSCRYSTATRWLQRVMFPLTPKIGTTTITTHIFRHRYFKQLERDGYSVEEIGEITGEVNPLNISGYINSSIYL